MTNPVIVSFCSRLPTDHPAYPGEFVSGGMRERRVELDAFLALRAELRKEVAELDLQIRTLEAEVAEARQKADERRAASCYVPTIKGKIGPLSKAGDQ
jgi:hypothetical protein